MRPEIDALLARVLRLGPGPDHRVILGIAGAPGSGKTTLARTLTATLVDALPGLPGGTGPAVPAAAYLPMDGFHLADVELRRLGRLDRKGAPDTFDAAGYRSLLGRLRDRREQVWAPAFDRELEQPVAGSIPVPPAVPIVVTEGNYLLLDSGPWAGVRALLDEVWFCRAEESLRVARLVARHERFGKSPAAARAWAGGTDQRNADLVATTLPRADLVVRTD